MPATASDRRASSWAEMSTTEVTPSSREMTTRWRMMGSKGGRSFCFGFLIVTVVVFLSETAKVPSALFRSAEAPRARPLAPCPSWCTMRRVAPKAAAMRLKAAMPWAASRFLSSSAAPTARQADQVSTTTSMGGVGKVLRRAQRTSTSSRLSGSTASSMNLRLMFSETPRCRIQARKRFDMPACPSAQMYTTRPGFTARPCHSVPVATDRARSSARVLL